MCLKLRDTTAVLDSHELPCSYSHGTVEFRNCVVKFHLSHSVSTIATFYPKFHSSRTMTFRLFLFLFFWRKRKIPIMGRTQLGSPTINITGEIAFRARYDPTWSREFAWTGRWTFAISIVKDIVFCCAER